MLQKISDHILAHLAEPIEVGDLAGLAGRSAFHFSRMFARSAGMTPHRYVVHLLRWIRRVHGVAPSELA